MTSTGNDLSSVPQTPVPDAAASQPAASQPADTQPPFAFAPPQQPPSQAAFVLAVARDVYADLVPESWRPVVKSVAATLLTLLVARLLFGRKRP